MIAVTDEIYGKKILIGVAGLLAIGLLNRLPPNTSVQATAASSFNSAYSAARSPAAPTSTGLHINSNITPVADISHAWWGLSGSPVS